MALTDKAYTSIHSKTGDAKDLLKDEFDAGYLGKISDIPSKEPALTALVYQVGLLQDELDYLRTEISDNKDKTVLALGTSGTTALAGDTNIVTIGSSTTIAFGNMITRIDKNTGKITGYDIAMTATKGGVSKSVTLTLT
tara:strand:- start:539 stop:955 length:417 start_codon:yes stop_codon:yes gene_type:complete